MLFATTKSLNDLCIKFTDALQMSGRQPIFCILSPNSEPVFVQVPHSKLRGIPAPSRSNWRAAK
jgi:hypothetical protein